MKAVLRALFAIVALFVVLPIVASGQAPATVTVFEGARIIIGDGRAPIENASFVVSGARITQVGRAGEVRVPAGAMRVNLSGKTMNDQRLADDLRRNCHVHRHGFGHICDLLHRELGGSRASLLRQHLDTSDRNRCQTSSD